MTRWQYGFDSRGWGPRSARFTGWSSPTRAAHADGRIIETLGHYDPLTDPSRVSVDAERARVWLSQGAQPSDTARRLLRQAGVLDEAGVSKSEGGEA